MRADPHLIAHALRVPASRFDLAIEGLMVGLLAFTPFAFAGTPAWAQLGVAMFVAAMAICLALKLTVDRSAELVGSWALVPIGAFLVLVGLQLVPWPAGLTRIVSPGAVGMRQELVGSLPGAAERLARQTVTLYPLVTWRDLRLVVVVSALFVIVLNVYRRPEPIKRLLLAITLVGLATALLAMYQNVVGDKTIYGHVLAAYPNCAAFTNYSQYAQFMNLSIGAALALLLVRLKERERAIAAYADGRTRREPEPITGWLLLLAGTFVVGATTVVLSMGRMGILSGLVAGVFTGGLVAASGRVRGRGSVVAILGLLVLAVLLWFGVDAAYSRLATLQRMDVVEGGRTGILRDLLPLFAKFPVFGSGLGTLEFVFPAFDRSQQPLLTTHAENEYAQLMAETGVVGLSCAIAFWFVIGRAFVTTIRTGERPMHAAVYGLGYGLIAILIHSASDFGQHALANATLTAVFAGLLITLSRLDARPVATADARDAALLTADAAAVLTPARLRRRFAGHVALTIAVLAVASLTVMGANTTRAATAQWVAAQRAVAPIAKAEWEGTDEQFVALLGPATEAVATQPTNASYRHWLNAYRWRSLSRESVEPSAEVVTFAGRVVDDLNAALFDCPTFGPAHGLSGQIERFVLNRPAEGAAAIRRGFALAPQDATAAMVAGRLAGEEGRWDDAARAFASATKVGATRRQVIDVYATEFARPADAYAIAAGDRDSLSYLAGLLEQAKVEPVLASRCRLESAELERAAAAGSDASPASIAQAAARAAAAGNASEAIDGYRRALIGDYGRAEWHYQLASELAKAGRVSEAMDSARICLRLRPQMTEAKQLLGELAVAPNAPR